MSLGSKEVAPFLFQHVIGEPDEASVADLGQILSASDLVEVWEAQSRVDRELYTLLLFVVGGWNLHGPINLNLVLNP